MLAAGTGLAAISLAVGRFWVFRGAVRTDSGSLWDLLLADPWTLGFARLAVFAFCLYALISVPILVAGDRWIRSFGPSGVSADEASATAEELARLQAELAETQRERDRAIAISEALMRLRERGSIG